ncbi:helix-turn-helix domain-containing protein [Streptacidiphilus fuscans]|uniref:Helix-turn-helix domain-containing protein n=1 Tax=Streptacidiphilus fuscans TaxID=2789292 RepID=A0A931BA32_9ACTN|nr:helix-turn-helix transcriptional regulator [Streptacidiphilus fuscans]MBF9069660.1 helix-turn-helix domain-containing protein [Streptacidiphilus fuscans]
MGTPLGDFIRTKRDSIQPETLGLPDHGRRRSPGLRRSDLAVRAGISVEYLTRIEQGRDRNPSPAVVNALADGLSLDTAERSHLRYLTKISGSECAGRAALPVRAPREVRPSVLRTLRLLEPDGIAMVANRWGDILAVSSTFETVFGGSGLLDDEAPNLTRYVFTDARARSLFADWDDIADQQVFDLWVGPNVAQHERLAAELAVVAGPEFTRRLNQHTVPQRGALRLDHPSGSALRFLRETLELAEDEQQLVVLLPADERTAEAVDALRQQQRPGLRAIS